MTVAESNEPVASNIERVISEKGLKNIAVAKKQDIHRIYLAQC